MNKARVIALYLPQYHPVKENDDFWGKGFTEWRNVAKAKPMYRGHYQPRIPADLGFYDLRLPEVREEQAQLAKDYGVEGFCYWHYWFGNGKMILEKPLEQVLKTGKPDFPFCVGWANHSWSNKTWVKTGKFKKNVVFLEQTYPGEEDLIAHFNYLLPAFKDERYIKVDGAPLFMVFNPFEMDDNSQMIELWNKLAKENGMPGIHFVARVETATHSTTKTDIFEGKEMRDRFNLCLTWGYNAIYSVPVQKMKIMDSNYISIQFQRILRKLHLNFRVEKHDYRKLIPYMFCDEEYKENVYPQIMPHWDNTPRQGVNGYIYTHESPELFGQIVEKAMEHVMGKDPEHRIIFAHSWNEWGEGAYLEPDLKYGLSYLEQLKSRVVEGE